MKATAPAIPVLSKAIRVVEAVARERPFRSITQLGKALMIAPATCYRIVKTLEHEDWLRLDEQGRPALSPGLLPVLEPLLAFDRLASVAQPALEELARRVGLSAKLSIRLGDEAAAIARAESPAAMSLSGRVGARFPLAVGSSGAALLSAMEDQAIETILGRSPEHAWAHQDRRDVRERIAECRATGCCADHGSYRRHVHSVSVALGPIAGQPAATITILGLPDDFAEHRHEELRSHLRHAARALAAAAPGAKDQP